MMLGHATYIALELGWGLPILAIQWLLGHRVLRREAKLLAIGAMVPIVYLSIADGTAIHQGIWSIRSSAVLGITFFDLPVEEIIFFSLTTLMVVQTLILVPAYRELGLPLVQKSRGNPMPQASLARPTSRPFLSFDSAEEE